ncbi:M14 family zinc carboxypeptidase [Parvularcula lutaonensis]|uniref:M14 family zinc carboxypeptidase n=1 Tax=Parvularcula lutaonensis TaxID=491923 RepID=A0ABV7MDP4_9PROT|nr:M14 family zinc carboxypeptidase [Parvularcula lutaonensis]GGY48950.1 peptidase M14 [Parvularcula lutaonensis]
MRYLLAGLSASLIGIAHAAPIEDIRVPGIVYDADVQTPDEYLGHGLGDKPVRHDQLVGYLSGLAETSDRIKVETIGYTHERRPILFFTVTSPENHERLDEIKQRHLASLESGEEPKGDQPSIIWINYGVHGAESAGMDASIPTLYHFAAAQGDEVERQLDESVILIVAILNPDGHSRRADHVETFSSVVPVTDPAHAQHQLWVEARTNHYWFDLNRQWLLLTQPEAKAWTTKWQEWKPQVSGDFHEMGSQSTFYFHPGEPKRKNPLIPDEARDLTKNIADRHREFLDSEARLYFTEQGFDNFYIGKGSTYPQANGGLGILFEVGAARGGAIESPSGERSYADNIRTHFRTTLTTIQGTLDQQEEIAAYQRNFFQSALKEAEDDQTKAYVFTTNGDRTRRTRFLELLKSHDIKVHRLAEDIEIGGKTYAAALSFVVPMDQMQYRMVRGVFDRVTDFEENIFYDVSGWTLPLAYDVDYAPLKSRVARGEDAGRFNPDLLGAEVTEIEKPTASRPSEASYGYVFEWTDRNAAKALYRLLSEDVLVRVALEPFEVRGEEGLMNFEAGAVFVPMARQEVSKRTIHRMMQAIAQDEGVEIHAVTSGAGDVATASLGGGSFRPVEEPSVLLLFDDGLSRYDAGEVWHLLDFEMRMPVTLRRKDQLGGLDWSRYTHLVMVGGGNVALSDAATERVKQWVREEGGTVVALRQSAHWAQDTFLDAGKREKPADEQDADHQKKLRFNYAEMDVRDAEHVIGGAIVATDLDTTHPLGFGYGDRMLPALRNTTAVLDWPKGNPYAVVSAYPKEDVLLSGYVSEKRRGELADTPAVIAQPLGRGNIVLIADNPVFRGTFLGTNKLFLNAIFFADLMDAPSGDYAVEE